MLKHLRRILLALSLLLAAGMAGLWAFRGSVLRPAGMARIAGRRVDVVSRGARIEVGTPVEVVEVRGNRVVVVPTDPDPSPPAAQAPSTRSDAPSDPVSQPKTDS